MIKKMVITVMLIILSLLGIAVFIYSGGGKYVKRAALETFKFGDKIEKFEQKVKEKERKIQKKIKKLSKKIKKKKK